MALFVVIIVSLFCSCFGVPFQHDIDYQHPDSGERVRLKSIGQLKETVDLDRINGIKRVICDKSKVLIAAETSSIAKTWKPGQVILGSSKWDCHRNTLGSHTKGIYARIQSVFFPTETGIVVHTEKAGAFDVIDEADIKFHYHPGQESSHPPDVRRRHRRYFANMLSELLHKIDWRANFSTTVPWNYDNEKKINGPAFRIVTTENSTSYDTQFGDYNKTNDEVFDFSCKECHGVSSFSYTFEMVIQKNAMNQPDIHHYLSKLETNCTILLDTSLKTTSGMRVDVSKSVLVTTPSVLFTIPVAVVEDARIPPVTLTVNYNSETHIDVNITAADEVTSSNRYNISGSYEIVQEYTKDNGMDGYVTATNWTVVNHKSTTTTNKDLQMSTSVYQKMNITTSIGWLARDMDITFSPPVIFRIKPILESVSSTKSVERCVVDTLYVTGDFNVSDARLIVDAFDVPIWDTILADGFNRSADIIEKELYKLCKADCFPSNIKMTDDYQKAEEVVGKMTHRITRNDSSYSRLRKMVGSSVLFASEEADTSSWCGYPGRKCQRCTDNSTGNDTCADRMMTSSLASKTSLLGEYVTAEWPERKLVVHEAWDEPTSSHPHGQHGNSSLHYEGRAAIYSVSSGQKQSSLSNDNTNTTANRLKELASCSNFPYVVKDENSNLVHVAVKKEELIHMKRKHEIPTNSKDKVSFENSMKKLDAVLSISMCPDINLEIHKHWPHTFRNADKACGSPSFTIKRNNEAMKTLYEYSDLDVDFESEGPLGSKCGKNRECNQCIRPSMSGIPWDWCGTRVMSPRMAFRLKRLAVLAKKHPDLKYGKVNVLKAFKEEEDNLYNNGRALSLTFVEHHVYTRYNGSTKVDKLASLAVCAGFDYVKYTNKDYIEVFVKEQAGYRTKLVPFPSGQVLISVDAPFGKEDEFSFPESAERESRKPLLVRSVDDQLNLANNFKIGEFKDKSLHYLRIDPTMVECLETVRDAVNEPIYVMKAYNTKSLNKEMNSEWNRDQLDRFQSGQAVVVQREDYSMGQTIELAKTLMSSCTPNLRMQRRGLDISIRKSSVCSTKLRGAKYCVYVGVYPMERTPQRQFVKLDVSAVSSSTKPRSTYGSNWSELKEYKSELLSGGPQVIPYNMEVCKTPDLGEGNGHLSFKLGHIGFCLSFNKRKQCAETEKPRNTEVDKLFKQLANTDKYLPYEIKLNIRECLVTHCGGCPGAGPVWDKKVKACVKLIDKYLYETRKPLVRESDRVAFFNTENENSAAHGLACKNGSKCVENVQLYSILHTALTSKYKPDPNNSIEELVFDGHDNPSPLLEIVEQQTAINAHGNVSVYIENVRDVSALRNVLKVLMIYNRNIKFVKFLALKGVKKEKIATTIQRKIETWAGSACPKWSRFAVAPYLIESVPASREARSIQDSAHRNKMKEKQRNWEIDWVMMT